MAKPIFYNEVPSTHKLKDDFSNFIKNNPQFSGFIKIGKTTQKNLKNRYVNTDKYERLDHQNVFCLCGSQEIALEIERKCQEFTKEMGKFIWRSDSGGGPIGDDSNNYLIYVTVLKDNLFRCPVDSCSTVMTKEGIEFHKVSHEDIVNTVTFNEMLKEMALAPMATNVDPIKWTYTQHLDSTECIFCGKYFPSKSSLKVHVNNYCPENKDKHHLVQCSVCDGLYPKSYLREHLESHEPKKECPVCHDFFSPLWIIRHMKTHQGIKHQKLEFTCEICGHTALSVYKVSHMKTHETEMAPCPQCMKLFRKNRLEVHIKDSHEKPKVKCTEDGCDFEGTPDGLRSHKQVHKPKEKCPYCSKEYSASSLKTHINSVHLRKTMKCPYCSKDVLIASMWVHKNMHERKGDIPCTSKSTNPPATKKSKKEE